MSRPAILGSYKAAVALFKPLYDLVLFFESDSATAACASFRDTRRNAFAYRISSFVFSLLVVTVRLDHEVIGLETSGLTTQVGDLIV